MKKLFVIIAIIGILIIGGLANTISADWGDPQPKPYPYLQPKPFIDEGCSQSDNCWLSGYPKH